MDTNTPRRPEAVQAWFNREVGKKNVHLGYIETLERDLAAALERDKIRAEIIADLGADIAERERKIAKLEHDLSAAKDGLSDMCLLLQDIKRRAEQAELDRDMWKAEVRRVTDAYEKTTREAMNRADKAESALAEARRDAERLRRLHETLVDAEGFEWGVYRVKWDKHGQNPVVWQTLSDHSDLDAVIVYQDTQNALTHKAE